MNWDQYPWMGPIQQFLGSENPEDYDLTEGSKTKKPRHKIEAEGGKGSPLAQAMANKLQRLGIIGKDKSWPVFLKEIKRQIRVAQEERKEWERKTGRTLHMGHGRSVDLDGPHWLQNTAPQFWYDNIKLKAYSGRSLEDMMDAQYARSILEAYLHWVSDTVKLDSPEVRAKFHHGGESMAGLEQLEDLKNRRRAAGWPELGENLDIGDAVAQSGEVKTSQMSPEELDRYKKLGTSPTGDTLQAFKNNQLAQLPSRLLRIGAPAVGGVFAADSMADAAQRTQIAQQTGNWLDKTQAVLAGIEATSDTVGMVPSKASIITEPAGFLAGVSNVGIDLGRTLLAEPTAEQEAIRASIPTHNPMTLQGQREEYKAIEAEINEEAIRRRIFESGGGNAAMTKHGWSIEETMNMGRKNEIVQAYKQDLNNPKR